MTPLWRSAGQHEYYQGDSLSGNSGVLLSSVGRYFAPQWIWDLPRIESSSPIHIHGGQQNPCGILVNDVPIRNIVRIGFCAEATIDDKFNITCNVTLKDRQPPLPPAQVNVAIFPQTPSLSHLFAHHLLDATAMLGLAAPLAQAGYNISWMHTGLLGHQRIVMRPPKWLNLKHQVRLRCNQPIQNFMLAVSIPSSTNVDFSLNGFAALPHTRQPERPRDWLPLWAYSVPFDGRCRSSKSYQNHSCPTQRRRNIVGLISRGGARQLSNELAVINALRKVLKTRNFQLHVLNEDEHLPQKFAPLYAIIGVHGSAFGNIIACARGTVVIEVTGALMPRMWANFATALDMRYFAYVAERYPRSLWSFHAYPGIASNVEVNTTRFAKFVADALDATNGIETQCGS